MAVGDIDVEGVDESIATPRAARARLCKQRHSSGPRREYYALRWVSTSTCETTGFERGQIERSSGVKEGHHIEGVVELLTPDVPAARQWTL